MNRAETEPWAEDLVATLEGLDTNIWIEFKAVNLDRTKWLVEFEADSMPLFTYILNLKEVLISTIFFDSSDV